MTAKKITEQELVAKMSQISKEADKLISDFNLKLQALKKQHDTLLRSIQKRIDDDKIKNILRKIK